MAYTISQLADLINLTQKKYIKTGFTDISLTGQRYFVWPELMKQERIMEDGGTSISFPVQIAVGQSSRVTAPFDTDILNVVDVSDMGDVPWRHRTTNKTWDVLEPAINSGDAKIYDVIEMRTHAMWNELVDDVETEFWGPIGSSDNGLNPYGCRYYINWTTAQSGFYAQYPFSGTSCAGITHANWQNYNESYTAVSDTDLYLKMRKAMEFTDFVAPVPHKNLDRGKTRRGLYTTYTILSSMEADARGNNPLQLGPDLAKYDGEVLFRGVPVNWVPYLQTNNGAALAPSSPVVGCANPVIGIDWSSMYYTFREGFFWKQGEAAPVSGSHTVVAQHVDGTYNLCCTNRRKNFIMALTGSSY